jgi:diketogulonate reductase-like aldo/keto reductase
MEPLHIGSTIGLAGGVRIPRLGLGTYKSQPGAEVERSVSTALALGYRHVDTASLYGNESGVGAALAGSGVAREDVFLTTKVWNDEQGYETTLAALERSLERLGTTYVDLYLVHWPMRAHLEATWRAMEDLLSAGKARSIGVSNFLPHHLEELLRIATVVPAVDQVEFHPRLQQPALQAYLTEHDIALEAWAPIMRGAVAEVPEIVRIAATHGVTPAQVSIRWVLQQGHIAIPKSVHDERVAENADVYGFELSDEEMAGIDSLDTGHRIGPNPDSYAW